MTGSLTTSPPNLFRIKVSKTVETYGRLDCAFNNAGVEGRMANTVEASEENFDRLIAINLKGVWLCMKYEIPEMLKHGGGAIVNTASAAGLVGVEGLCAYNASKHGVIGLTKTAAREFAQKNIRVNSVCPGVINTPMVVRMIDSGGMNEQDFFAAEPVARMGKPEEIGEGVIWLLSEAASFVTGHSMSMMAAGSRDRAYGFSHPDARESILKINRSNFPRSQWRNRWRGGRRGHELAKRIENRRNIVELSR
jgi:NAD(P)-dependent dehydrogenase (short-subunit alcohol dehydrogenase family)